jgi:preprotein translocase subunit SecD
MRPIKKFNLPSQEQRKQWWIIVALVALTAFATVIALPSRFSFTLPLPSKPVISGGSLQFRMPGDQPGIVRQFQLKQGLDIQGGMQVVLRADMSQVQPLDRPEALESARQVILRRVDLYGVAEPVVQTSSMGQESRLIVELAGVEDPSQALALIGSTANLDFRIQNTATQSASTSALLSLTDFVSSGLTGKQLQRARVQFDPQTGQPTVSLQFTEEGTKLFADLTTRYTGQILAIFLDDAPLMLPRIQTPILNGQAQVSGEFTVEEAKQLAIQLNAGALPVPIEVIQQRTVGASLGQQSVSDSIQAGLIGLALVFLFMILYYGWKGVLASMALGVYAVLTIALYKIMGITLTLPGIAGLLLSIGMAVDSNILIFERMKEELRDGKPFSQAMELGFGKAWDSIKDANLATILTSLVLINPFHFSFLNTSGLVRGFGVTLLIGVLVSLFTGIVVTRTLMRTFLAAPEEKS